jgi:low temperature requirement protein LtrA
LGGIAARRRLAAAETIDTDRWRDPNETLRTATPLKLLYDLAFVVAFAAAAEQLGMERSGRARSSPRMPGSSGSRLWLVG